MADPLLLFHCIAESDWSISKDINDVELAFEAFYINMCVFLAEFLPLV